MSAAATHRKTNPLRAFVIATAVGLVAPCYTQVTVINGGVEHVYGPGGKVLDSPQAKEKSQTSRRHMREGVAGPVEQQGPSVQQSGPRGATSWNNDAARRQAPKIWWNNNGYVPPKSAWSQ